MSTRAVTLYKNGAVYDTSTVPEDFDICHVGFVYYNLDAKGLGHTVEVRAFDNTYKDLKVLHADGVSDEVISSPANEKDLTTFGGGDYYVTKDLSNEITEVSAADLSGMEANGSALKISHKVNEREISIKFGRALSKTDIDNGACVILRAYTSYHGPCKYSTLYSLDKSNTGDHTGGVDAIFNRLDEACAGGKFVDIVLSNDEVKALTDSDGAFRGFRIYS